MATTVYIVYVSMMNDNDYQLASMVSHGIIKRLRFLRVRAVFKSA